MSQENTTELTDQDYEIKFADRHMLDEILAKWASETPEELAMVDSRINKDVSWKYFEQITTALAVSLLGAGFNKGDYLVASLPMSAEYMFLFYACMKVGVILLPFDTTTENDVLLSAIDSKKAKAFAFENSDLAKNVQEKCSSVEVFLQFGNENAATEKAQNIKTYMEQSQEFARNEETKGMDSEILNEFTMRGMELDEDDAVLEIPVLVDGANLETSPVLHMDVSKKNMFEGAKKGLDQGGKVKIDLENGSIFKQFEDVTDSFFWGSTAEF